MSTGARGLGRLPSFAFARALREPFTRRSWAEAAYAFAGLPLALGGFAAVVVPVALLTPPVIVVGLPLVAASSAGVRRLGMASRALALRLLGLAVAEPASFRPEAGFFGWMRSALTDQPAWRARGYFIAKAPVELASLAAVVTFRAGSLIYLASPIEWAANLWTRRVVAGGVTRRYVVNFGTFYFDTWPRMALAVGIGVAGWWLSPWVLRGVLWADRALIAGLLGPSSLPARVRQLERSRTQAVEGAETRLRRIERDPVLDPEVVNELLSASRRSDALSRLTGREREVLALMAEGRSNSAIAASLVVTQRAVEKHITSIFHKLGLPASDADHRRVLAVLRYLG